MLAWRTGSLFKETAGLRETANKQREDTLQLIAATKDAANAAVESNKINRDLFISSNRPKLRVRNVVIKRPKGRFGYTDKVLQAGHLVGGQLYVSNIGGTAARVAESYGTVVCIQRDLPMERPYEGHAGNWLVPPDSILADGPSIPGTFQSPDVLSKEEVAGIEAGSHRLFVMGWIEYRDERSVLRRTAFCREFRQGRFVIVDNPDYEHEE